MRNGWVADSFEQAAEEFGTHYVSEMRFYCAQGILAHHPEFDAPEKITAESTREHIVVGTPEQCRERLEQYAEELGVDYFTIRFRMVTGPSFEATREQILRFGEEVVQPIHAKYPPIDHPAIPRRVAGNASEGAPMTDPATINFFDPATNDCPYHAYQTLRDEAPVWQDPHTGMFVVTRYEDIKSILANPGLFTNAVGSAAGMTEKAVKPDRPRRGGQGRAGGAGGARARPALPGRGLAAGGDAGRPRPAGAHGAAADVRPRLPARTRQAARPLRRVAHQRAVRRLHRRRRVRVGEGGGDPAAAVRDRSPDGRARGGHAADQGVDRRVGAAPRADADVRRADVVGAPGDRGPALLPADLRAPARAPRGHAAQRPRQQRDPRMGPPAHRRRAALGDDGRPVRRRLRDDHQRAQRRRAHAHRAARRCGSA